MTGIIKRTTENYNLRIPIFDAPGWGREVERNFDILDAVTYAISGFTAVRGIWTNGTLYEVGDRVVDQDSNTVWRCLVGHTSSVTGTFSDERTANPTYWEVISSSMVTRGTWQPNTDYKANEIVTYDNKVAIVVVQNYTSSASFDQDVTDNKLAVLIDLNPQLDAAQQSADDSANSADASANSASAAYTSELNAAASEQSASDYADNASTSEGNAATSASNAHTSELNAAASASAAATSETNAATSETNAYNSEVQAGTYTSQAQAARDQTLAALDQFDDRYLGEKVSDPSTDNDGEPLVAGALYFNTVDGVMKVYTGAAWVHAYVYGGDFYLKTEADARFLGIHAKADDSNKLNGQLASYYEDITARLGFTPLDAAGGTVSGSLTVSGTLKHGANEVWDAGNFTPSDYLKLTGGTLSGGIKFGSQTASATTDLSRHIDLYGGSYGFSITGSHLNIVAGGGNNIVNAVGTLTENDVQVALYNGTHASGTWGINISGWAYDGATRASYLRNGGSGTDMAFNWSGQSGQPSWLWGSNDGANNYVYNPSNFNVNYANSAGYASSAGSATNATNANYANSAGSTTNARYLTAMTNGGWGGDIGAVCWTPNSSKPAGVWNKAKNGASDVRFTGSDGSSNYLLQRVG